MPDNTVTTGTTDDATGTTAQAAGGSAGAAGGSESIEERLHQAEQTAAELQRKNEQLLSERTRVEEQTRDLERQRQELQRHQAGANATGATDPDAVVLSKLNATLAKFGEDSYEGQQALITAKLIIDKREITNAFRFREHLDAQLDDLPEEDAKHRREVRKLVRSGKAQSVEAALAQVKGSASGDVIKRLEARIAELEKGGAKSGDGEDVISRAKTGRTSNVQTAVTSQIDAATHRKVPTLEDYNRVMAAGGPEAKKLQKDIDEGRVEDPNFS